ncbi:hypothetical protein TNCV_3337401 [Trichonephila clavipes]|nr:hypothetical protein TNCV_3337401 [Trichonephila clavipes]
MDKPALVWALKSRRLLPFLNGTVLIHKLESNSTGGQPQTVRIKGVLPQNWDETEPNRTDTCMVLKATANDRRTSSPCRDEFLGLQTDTVRQLRGVLICVVWKYKVSTSQVSPPPGHNFANANSD